MDLFFLLLPLGSLLLMVLVHVVHVRLKKVSIAPTGIFLGFISGMIFIVGGIGFVLIRNFTLLSLFNSTAAFFFYFVLAYCYYHFVNISEASVRLRIFSELKHEKNFPLSKLTSYQQNEIPLRRVERLIASGDIIFRNNKYFLGKQRYLIAAKTLQFAKYLLGIKLN